MSRQNRRMIEYRTLGAGDADGLRRMRLALWPDDTEDAFRAALAAGLVSERSIHFGAFDDCELVGFVEGSIRDWGDGCETAPVTWVEGIYVTEALRRNGVGHSLVELVANWARARDIKELGSDASIDNSASLQAHARWGFAETERVARLRRWL
jgi:aminoglycoside 6'-N-acetyltransferase I